MEAVKQTCLVRSKYTAFLRCESGYERSEQNVMSVGCLSVNTKTIHNYSLIYESQCELEKVKSTRLAMYHGDNKQRFSRRS